VTKQERNEAVRQFIEKSREVRKTKSLTGRFSTKPLNQVGAAIERFGFEPAMCLLKAKRAQARKDQDRGALEALQELVTWLDAQERERGF
jgi:hypothetical protein